MWLRLSNYLQNILKLTILLSIHVIIKGIENKTHDDAAFNPQILLLEEPNLNSRFLQNLELEKENQIR